MDKHAAPTGLNITGLDPVPLRFGVDTDLDLAATVLPALADWLFGDAHLSPSETDVPADAPCNTYAILDAGRIVGCVEILDASGLDHHCLYQGELAREVPDLAPWLVKLDPENLILRKLMLGSKETPPPAFALWPNAPALYIRSRLNLDQLLSHLRHFGQIDLKDSKPVFLRYWGPLVLEDIMTAYGAGGLCLPTRLMDSIRVNIGLDGGDGDPYGHHWTQIYNSKAVATAGKSSESDGWWPAVGAGWGSWGWKHKYRAHSPLTTLALGLCIGLGLGSPTGTAAQWSDDSNTQKETTTMVSSDTAAAPHKDDFLVGRILLNPVAPNPLVPRLDTDTISPYASHTDCGQFARARLSNERLVFLQEWERDRAPVPQDTIAEDQRISAYGYKPAEGIPAALSTVFFKPTIDGNWVTADVEETQGEGRFIRLRMLKSLRSDDLTLVAEQIDEFVIQHSAYKYHPDGSLARIITRQRQNNSEPHVQIVSE